MTLAVYACHPEQSRGRRYVEPPAFDRTEFQRDRDRIVHSSAFRRLVYKTQVFLNHEGDMFRTRLTHSLEVAQLGRSMARALQLNEDLVEAISLAHDLGHTPFGHAGQDALNECMQGHGGFEHNLQSLRVVDELERRYPNFDGLNLSFEAREGILKHCARRNAEALEADEFAYTDGKGGVGRRFLERYQPSLEAQLCNLADEIAYNAHDMDDGVRSGLLTMEQIRAVPLFERYCNQTLHAHGHLAQAGQERRLLYETIRQMLSAQVRDVNSTTAAALVAADPKHVWEVRGQAVLVQFSHEMRQLSRELKAFLFDSLYRHAQVVSTMEMAKQIVRELFAAYVAAPHEMHRGSTTRALDTRVELEATDSFRLVADHVAGMTDRFAASEHYRLTGVRLLF
jgi:dGTPase